MTKKGLVFLILFALPFAAVGVGFGGWMGSTLVAHLKMRGWQEVPARIVHADLKAHRGKSTTYEVTAEYAYQCGGRPYTGRRVSLYGGSDNVGSFHQDAYRQLSQYQKSGRPFRCYVDPQRPAEAILYRDLRWEMIGFQSIFVLLFGGVGFGLLAAGLWGYRTARAEGVLAAAHPQEPWLHKPDWAAGTVVSSNRVGMLCGLAAAAFWNVISAPLWFTLPGEIVGKGNRLALLGAIFPAVGLGLIACAVYLVLRWRRFGQSFFQMAAVPGVVGGQLAGVVRTSAKVRPADGFRLTLSCLEKVTSTKGGKNRSTSENVLWQDDQVVNRDLLEQDPSHTAIPVLFAIPYECRPTDKTLPNSQTIWRLEVKAKVPGVDYGAAFDVPVFKTGQSDPNFAADPKLMAEYAAPANPQRDLRDARVVRGPSPSGEGYEFIFPMGRNLGNSLAFLAFWLIWSGAVVLMIYLKAPIFFPIVFGPFDVLLLFFALDLWFYRSAVDVSPRGLTVTGGLFGRGRPQWVDASDVARIEPVKGMQSGQSLYYDIVVTRRGGKKITAAKRIVPHHLAQAIADQIAQAMAEPSGTASK